MRTRFRDKIHWNIRNLGMYIQSDWYHIIWLKLRIKPNFLYELSIKSISISLFTSWNVLHCILFPINPYNTKFFKSSFGFTFLPIQLIGNFSPTHGWTFTLLIPWRMLPVTSHANLLWFRVFVHGDLQQMYWCGIEMFRLK